MQQKDALALLKKHREGTATEEEKALLDSWYLNWKKDEATGLSEQDYMLAEASILRNLPSAPNKAIRLWPRIAVAIAAAVFLVLSVGLWFFNTSRHSDAGQNPGHSLYSNDLAPGKQGATLTLANGQKIKLANASNGELAEQAGISISKTADGKLVYEITSQSRNDGANSYNTLSTEKGETYELHLPDGSLVWLNAASSLTYATNLKEHGLRRVKLDGEAYFEVAKDKAHPFIVKTVKQEVEVLGTHFNINSYANEPTTKTTLLEGSVRVNQNTILKPDEQAVSTPAGIKVIHVAAESYVDWKDGVFNFRKEELQSIMRKISRWYNVEIEYKNIDDDGTTYTGYISRSEHVSKVLQTLTKISNLKFRIEKAKIIVSK